MALLELRDIAKHFGAIEALKGVYLNLEPGEVLGLMGDNGAGKSTLVKIIAGNFPPSEGTIELETDWSSGVDQLTIIPKKGAKQLIVGGRSDTTRAHWQNFVHCVRTREKPVSDVEFGYQVQVALNMAMLSFLKKKVATFDADRPGRYRVAAVESGSSFATELAVGPSFAGDLVRTIVGAFVIGGAGVIVGIVIIVSVLIDQSRSRVTGTGDDD